MHILWHGQSCFQFESNGKQKDEKIKLVIDPFSPEKVGIRLPKLEADVLCVSHGHEDHNFIKGVKGDYFFIDTPGEYEAKGIAVDAIPSYHDEKEGKERGKNIIFSIEMEGIRICHMGDFGQKELTSEQAERIGNVDILLIPVGGVYTIGAKEAAHIVSQIEPAFVIPMHYKIPKLKIKLDSADDFLKVMAVKNPETMGKLNIKKKDIPQQSEQTKVIVLKP